VDADSKVSVPTNARVINGDGLWLIPGLIETHTHTTDAAALRAAFALGVTGALVIWTGTGPAPDIENSSMNADNPIPRVHLVGGRFSAEFPGRFVPTAPRFAAPKTTLEAESALDALVEAGVRRIKIWQDDGAVWSGPGDLMQTLSPAVFQALASGAKRRGMTVYVHTWQLRYYREALQLPADAGLHPVMDAPLAQSDVDLIKRKRLPWTTTMAQLLFFGDRQGYARRITNDSRLTSGLVAGAVAGLQRDAATTSFPELSALVSAVTQNVSRHLALIRENTRRVVAAGVQLTVGSDRPVGYGTHLEMELMTEGGLPATTVLKAATAGGATLLGVSQDLGTVRPGKLADLVLLGSNPLSDVRNLRDVRFVMKGGHLWSQKDLQSQ
jgi:imidazolonepropionase-like amidohydrolase